MLSIRPATVKDATLLKTLIRELAEYERLSHEVVITEEDVLRDGFGERPKFRAIIAEWDGQVAGYALFFEVYSSFQGRAGLLLEDLFVRTKVSELGGLARRYWCAWLKSPCERNIPTCAGKCSTGTLRLSSSTKSWAGYFLTSGKRYFCWKTLWKRW